jgi:hypothetical protein
VIWCVDSSGREPAAGCCEHSNEPAGSVNCLENLLWLSDWWLLKKGSDSWT